MLRFLRYYFVWHRLWNYVVFVAETHPRVISCSLKPATCCEVCAVLNSKAHFCILGTVLSCRHIVKWLCNQETILEDS
jgi:hypothetical protein